MAKKVLNIFKKIGRAYMEGATQLYGPIVECKIYPFV